MMRQIRSGFNPWRLIFKFEDQAVTSINAGRVDRFAFFDPASHLPGQKLQQRQVQTL